MADANRDLIVGIKVRVGRNATGTSGHRAARHRALQVAKEAGMPLMAISTIRRRAMRRCWPGCGRATC